ncbi:hypothetical protein F0562_005206 [Nyssa sinensis]|uniref:Uncharacterized protein n=1 Tax=Nyssa sinensis TaxID=561372 RepID=A0A5J5ALW7_9ASTE|nr:hypothetical protein F0562_005206 [Nyssa sinensis]
MKKILKAVMMMMMVMSHNEQVSNQNKHDADEDNYSDDSLASDASSGPSQHEKFVENGEGSHIVHLKHDKSKNHNTADSYSACKKANEQEKKRNEISIEVKNEDLVLVIKSATTAQVLQVNMLKPPAKMGCKCNS